MFYALINGFCVATGDNLKSLSIVVRSYPGTINLINDQKEVVRTIRSRAKPIVESNQLPNPRLLSCLRTYR